MFKKIIQILVISIALFFSGCSLSKEPVILYKFSGISNSDYTFVKTQTLNESDSAIFTSINLKVSSNKNNNEVIQSNIWIPQDTSSSHNKICLLIPPFMSSSATMYPMAVKLLKKGIPVVFLNYRGVKGDKMENFEKDYGINEINDGIYLLYAAGKYLNYDSLKTAIYGVSLGSAIALNIASNDTANLNIKAIALESLPYDFEETAQKMFPKKEVNKINAKISFEQVKFFQPSYIVPKLDKDINIFAVWANQEKYINKRDIDTMINLFQYNGINFSYELVNTKAHHFRYGYPLTKEESAKIDSTIVDFIYKNLNK